MTTFQLISDSNYLKKTQTFYVAQIAKKKKKEEKWTKDKKEKKSLVTRSDLYKKNEANSKRVIFHSTRRGLKRNLKHVQLSNLLIIMMIMSHW